MQDSFDFKEIDKARKTLGLGKTATLKEIKEAYRNLAKEHHPDKRSEEADRCENRMKEINKAYNIIKKYAESYRYSFIKEKIEDTYEGYMKGFNEDWMWGLGKADNKKKRPYKSI